MQLISLKGPKCRPCTILLDKGHCRPISIPQGRGAVEQSLSHKAVHFILICMHLCICRVPCFLVSRLKMQDYTIPHCKSPRCTNTSVKIFATTCKIYIKQPSQYNAIYTRRGRLGKFIIGESF